MKIESAFLGNFHFAIRHMGMFVSISSMAACASSHVIIAKEIGLPCDITVDSTTWHLGRDSTISLSEPSWQFAVDSRGRWYAGAVESGRVLQWSSDGRLIRVIGRPGDGPGELGGSLPTVHVVPGDTLYVRDSHMHWVVFDPTGRYIRTASTGGIEGIAGKNTAFLSNGLVVSGVNTAPFGVIIADREGHILRRFDPRPQGFPGQRPVAVANDRSSFWIGPEAGPKAGYRIERWDTSGKVLQTIVRDVPWFKAQSDFSAEERPQQPKPFPFPSISSITVDSLDRLWVVTTYPIKDDAKVVYSRAFRALEEQRMTPAVLDRLRRTVSEILALHFDIFDAKTGRLLAAGDFSASDKFIGMGVSGKPMWSRLREDSLGMKSASLLAFSIAGRGNACR